MMYTYTQLEDYIKKLYSFLSIDNPSNIDMKDIASRLKIKLNFWDEKSEATYIGGKFYIWLNKLLPKQEIWEEFGHELCHVLTHEGHQSYMDTEFLHYQEIKAENFALHFCVPTFMLLKYEVVNYHNIKDGIPFVTQTFNVTEKFAKKRLNHFRNQIQQAKSDEQHRKYMESLYRKAPPYSDETNSILHKLNFLLEKKKKGVSL
ncbi:ImmA/IrrE family metallo-endopeptidase [Heyndrickxia oleronia]|uniref:ImmA/IrrE family metallo-endopeptidase n=1 Tax=Heyndrickxia oleronia TaxID=38875 RepID=A0AAW6SQ36_9BACI|nr:ImmA/IrrE family metallo-endopeptidase [Heyndrickxia oleronia]MDH5160385.1 ImmA/IrrE family metallo-endopeptidase [Heyndrickxia oleronia]